MDAPSLARVQGLALWMVASRFLSTVAAQPATITTVDAAGSVGRGSSVAISFPGNLISYVDETNHRLKLAACQDADCTISTKYTADLGTNVGGSTSAARFMNYAAISYHDADARDLKVLSCGMPCDFQVPRTVDEAGDVGVDSALAIRPDGKPVIAYTDTTNQALKVASCHDGGCATATITSYPGRGGRNPTISIGADGNPRIAADNGLDLFVGTCTDAACTTATFVTVAGVPFPPSNSVRYTQPSLAVGEDGRPVVAYVVERGSIIGPGVTVQLARCSDATCSALTPLAAAPQNWNYAPSVAVMPGNLPVVSYYSAGDFDVPPYRLRMLSCLTPSCASPTVLDVDGPSAGRDASLRVVGDVPFISYYDDTNADLKVAVLDGGPTRPPDVSIVFTNSPASAYTPGGPISWFFDVRNVSTTTARGVTARAEWPAGISAPTVPSGLPCTFGAGALTCTFPDLLPGNPFGGAFSATVTETALTSLSLTMTATADGDVNAANGSVTSLTTVLPRVSFGSATAVEGDAGTTILAMPVLLSRPDAHTIALDYATVAGGAASPGVDYLPASGSITFPPGATLRTVPLSVLGDTQLEQDEGFVVQFTGQQTTALLGATTVAVILDDDPNAAAVAELAHGSRIEADLGGPTPGVDVYRIARGFAESYEVVIDAVAGHASPIVLERLGADGSTVLQESVATGTGGSRSLRFEALSPVANELVRVRSMGCTTECGANDRYRIRAYETTLRGARFNNRSSQMTVVLLQNTGEVPVTGFLFLWDQYGEAIWGEVLTIPANGTAVVDTTASGGFAADGEGSLTVRHDAPYGVLRGKAVALDPATGLSFDTPFTVRER